MTLRKFLCALTALLLAVSCAACGAGGTPELPSGAYPVEKNTGDNAADYPYVIHTPSAIWYLADADIKLQGREAYFENLDFILQNQEADFADAREALASWIWEEIPPVTIITDFAGLTEKQSMAGASYIGGKIYLYYNWDLAGYALLHEYVHYLTMTCTNEPASQGFYAEGIAEYFSRFVCTNRMCRDSFPRAYPDAQEEMRASPVWDPETDSVDLGRLYLAWAEAIRSPENDGIQYDTIGYAEITRTAEHRENPHLATLSYYETGSMMAYLVETYGEEAVFPYWGLDPYDMKAVFGKDFTELYWEWAAWNTRRCAELGLTIPQG